MNAWTVVATAGGLGRAPIAPGTVATIAAVVMWWLLPAESQALQWWIAAALIIFGTLAADREARRAVDKDPSSVVIDEVAGIWLVLAGGPKTLSVVAAGVVLFRLLDITKPPPIRQLERLPHGLGIMADDLAAGLVARLSVALLISRGWLS